MGALKSIGENAVVRFVVVGTVALLLGTVTPRAVGDSIVVLTVVAQNADGQGSYNLAIEGGPRGEPWCTLAWTGTFDIVDPSNPGVVIGTLKELALSYDADPAINLHFSVVAGGSTTTFTITSALQAVNPPIPAAVARGRATSAFSVTDGPLGGGATLAGLEPGGGAYIAQYNGFVPGGATFASQIQQITFIPPDRSRSDSVNDPDADPTHYRAVGATVNDISAEIKFTLTPRDLASGSTTYEIMPEPAGLMLLAAGAAGLRWRRRI